MGAGQPYSSSLPARDAKNDDIYLVYAVQGGDLPPAHGFPLRATSSRKWGYKMTKWLVEILAGEPREDRKYS